MKNLISVLLSLMFLLLTGCSTITFYADYQLSLSDVERPQKVSGLYGVQKIDTLKDDSKYNYCYEDSLVRILWHADSKQIVFSIENKTDNTLKIPWDNAAYMDENGNNHRVIHSGTKFNNRANPQPPSVIISKGHLEDFVFPADYIQFVPGDENTASYWIQDPLLLDSEKRDVNDSTQNLATEEFNNSVKENLGKSYKVLLPLQIDDSISDYVFTFKIVKCNVWNKQVRNL